MRFALVTGCPRSGTTAVASWLASQDDVRGLMETRRTIAVHAMMREARRFWCFDEKSGIYHGERATSPSVLAEAAFAAMTRMFDAGSDNRKLLVDKEPLEPVAFPLEDYAAYLDDMRNALGAKLLCMVRNPVDTVASMMKRKWGYSLRDEKPKIIAENFCTRIWRTATRAVIRSIGISPRDVLIQRHEDLVSDPKTATEEIRRFLEVPLMPFEPTKTNHAAPGDGLDVVQKTSWERRILGYEARMPTKPKVVLLTGPPGAGKTTVAWEIEFGSPHRFVVLDGDDLRRNLWPELGYSNSDRYESMKRATQVAALTASKGATVLLSMVAPFEDGRQEMAMELRQRQISFSTVCINARADVLNLRRPPNDRFHPVVYEPPDAPTIFTNDESPRLSAEKAIQFAGLTK